MLDLYSCAVGKSYRISKLLLDRSVCARLEAMGLNKDAYVSVSIKNSNGVIVNVHGAKIAISKKLSRRIVTKQNNE